MILDSRIWRRHIYRCLGGGAMAVGLATVLAGTSPAQAVPTLQVGVPLNGGYAPYQDNLTNPEEDDTAVTNGNTLALGGVFGPNTLALGGQYQDGPDWSDLGYADIFDGSGALLFAVVPDGALGDGSLTVNGIAPLYTTADFEDGFVVPNPPSNHAPIQNGDYLFFDVGDFTEFADAVPNFADDGEASADGEVKTVTFQTSGYDWIHFDVFAIETVQTGPNVRSDLVGNPGSHDVTFKVEDDNGGGGPPPPIPEPMTAGLGLMGLGALALSCARRRRNH